MVEMELGTPLWTSTPPLRLVSVSKEPMVTPVLALIVIELTVRFAVPVPVIAVVRLMLLFVPLKVFAVRYSLAASGRRIEVVNPVPALLSPVAKEVPLPVVVGSTSAQEMIG